MLKVYEIAEKEIGQKEIKGEKDNLRIVEYLKTVSSSEILDEVAWCSAFVAWTLLQAGIKGKYKANARSFLNIGESVDLEKAEKGNIVVLWRGSPSSWQGHVGFFVKAENGKDWLLGGNQNDSVSIQSFPISR